MQHALTPLHLRLMRDLIQPVLQIMAGITILCRPNDDPRRVFEQVIHLFEGAAGRLREERPEEDGVGEIADDEDVIVFVADVGHGDGGDLSLERRLDLVRRVEEGVTYNQCVEGEAGHCCDGDTLTASSGVEYLCWDDPAERSARTAETEVI